MVSTHVSFLLDNSRQLGPKKLQGLKSLSGQQLLEHIYARTASRIPLLPQVCISFHLLYNTSSFLHKKELHSNPREFKKLCKKITVAGRKGEDEKKGSYEIKKACPTDIHIKQNFFRQNKECICPLKSVLFRDA